MRDIGLQRLSVLLPTAPARPTTHIYEVLVVRGVVTTGDVEVTRDSGLDHCEGAGENEGMRKTLASFRLLSLPSRRRSFRAHFLLYRLTRRNWSVIGQKEEKKLSARRASHR